MDTSLTWTETVITDTDQRKHTITGLTNPGTYKVRVRARAANLEDHDGDPGTPHETVHRLGFTSEILTVATSSANWQAPGLPARVRATPGDSQSLIVEWEPPSGGGALVHAYQVRYAFKNTEGWTESELIYPRPTRRICDVRGECKNPRRYEISGLTAGQSYDVAVRAYNINGAGEWAYAGGQNIPNN